MELMEPIMKPRPVLPYNIIKKGVDLSDQLFVLYIRKTLKWYKKFGIEVPLDTCIVNSLVIFKYTRNKNKIGICSSSVWHYLIS